ncbi:MAG: hypothetical protein PXY39_04330 [archaeon]|nr:hypothetical protein [archaeon]
MKIVLQAGLLVSINTKIIMKMDYRCGLDKCAEAAATAAGATMTKAVFGSEQYIVGNGFVAR